jgi:hypothetical protein
MRAMDDFAPEGGSGGIRIYTPSPEYLFAMKCMAMRPEGMDGSHDFSDIEFLAEETGIRDAKSALDLIEAFYPASRIPARVALGVEEIMARIARRRASLDASAPRGKIEDSLLRESPPSEGGGNFGK